jgi:hypothetical protein
MDLIFSNRQFAVFNNVLSDKESGSSGTSSRTRSITRFISSGGGRSSAWATAILWRAGSFSHSRHRASTPRVKIYPTNTAIDILVKFMTENSSRYQEWVGVRGKDWEVFSAKSYLFPRGSGLS